MKICAVVMFFLVAYVTADCGCLKCSKHLQGVDVPGPAGHSVKVIFRRPNPKTCECCCGCGAPKEPPCNKIPEVCKTGTTGGQYSAAIQLPIPKLPKPRRPLKNLKYRTDTILVPPPPPTVECPSTPAIVNPSSLTTADILNWLRSIQLSHQLQQQPPVSAVPQLPNVQCPSVVPQLITETVPCECQHCQGNPLLAIRSCNFEGETFQWPYHQLSKKSVPSQGTSPGGSCQKSKRSVSTQEESTFKSHSIPAHSVRSKRDLGKRSYNFLMNMIPQSIREPLHHSVQGTRYLQQLQPKPTLKQKLDEIMIKKNMGLGGNIFDQYKPQPTLGQLGNIFNKPSNGPFGQKPSNYFQQSNPFKSSFLDQPPKFLAPSHLYGRATNSYLGPAQTFGTQKIPKLSLLNQKNVLEYLKPNQKLVFGKTKYPLDPSMENMHKKFFQKYGSLGTPRLSLRSEGKETADEKTLLKKLKKLNNNSNNSNLEDQATAFMQQLLKPDESKRRRRRSTEYSPEKGLLRKKRTIILGSDEINIPAHYEIEMVSVEDDCEEDQQHEESFEAFEEEDPVVGVSPFMRNFAPAERYYPRLPRLQPKPEIVLGKNVIQKAVREELESHHRKLEREQKIKEMKETRKRKKQQSIVPQNPIFALLTAPVRFLQHFNGINKGPVMSNIPKLVYTTKKAFRDLGKNIQKNCLDLASNVIGDFDNVHPTIIHQIVEPEGRRYRRGVQDFQDNRSANNRKYKNKISKGTTASTSNNKPPSQDSQIKLENVNQINKTEISVKPAKQTNTSSVIREDGIFSSNDKTRFNPKGAENNSKSDDGKKIIDQTSKTDQEALNDIKKHFAPDYTLVFENSKETSNFREVPDKHVRKKRYVVRVVDEDGIQEQVEDYLTQQLQGHGQHEYLNSLQDYYNKVYCFLTKLYSTHQPLCKIGDDCYYQRPATAEETYLPADEAYYKAEEDEEDYLLESYEDSSEERPKNKKIQIKEIKPRVIIDRKGRPFIEFDGYKRPLMLHRKKLGILKATGHSYGRGSTSSEETGTRIATLIARAKTDSEVVGNSHNDIVPHKLVKERISSLLEEIDQLIHLNPENYDEIFEDLIKIQHIKTSIEQDWKRMLIDARSNDITTEIHLLSKFKELQHVKNNSVRKIAAALKQNDNEFVRCQLVKSLIGLQKLQCLISSVVEDFEQHLKMKTQRNTKKEIKYVDYLSGLKFAFAKTRNDLIKMLGKDRDKEGLKNMEMLHKLKKLLISANDNPEKFDQAAKLLWEMKNLEKMQKETIKEMNKKLARNCKIKKELKILFDLQRRFEDCSKELSGILRDIHVTADNTIGKKKDIKEVIAEVKKKHEEMLQKAKDRSKLLKKS